MTGGTPISEIPIFTNLATVSRGTTLWPDGANRHPLHKAEERSISGFDFIFCWDSAQWPDLARAPRSASRGLHTGLLLRERGFSKALFAKVRWPGLFLSRTVDEVVMGRNNKTRNKTLADQHAEGGHPVWENHGSWQMFVLRSARLHLDLDTWNWNWFNWFIESSILQNSYHCPT